MMYQSIVGEQKIYSFQKVDCLLSIYKATYRDLNVLFGDVFNLETSYAGLFDVIWDCNAIVAINADDRERYVKAELSVLKEGGRILMTTWVYEQSIHLWFPLCVSPEMVEKLFAAQCDVRVVENIDLPNDSPFCQRHELPWAIRPVLFLNRKKLVYTVTVLYWCMLITTIDCVSKYNNYQLCPLGTTTFALSCNLCHHKQSKPFLDCCKTLMDANRHSTNLCQHVVAPRVRIAFCFDISQRCLPQLFLVPVD